MRPSSGAPVTSPCRAIPTPRDGEIHVWPHPREHLHARRRRRQHRRAGRRRRRVCRRHRRGARWPTRRSLRSAALSDKPIQFIANTNFQPDRPAATSSCSAPGPIRACAGRSSRCSSATRASAPRSSPIRTCRTGWWRQAAGRGGPKRYLPRGTATDVPQRRRD